MQRQRRVGLSWPIQTNPLVTRLDMQTAFEQLCKPLQPYFSEGKARLRLGHTSSGAPNATAEMEGLSRILWGLVPYLSGDGNEADELWEIMLQGIRHGTDPTHPEYWGQVTDYDQRLVEMAAIGFALAFIPERVWEPLTEQDRRHLYAWLNQINHHALWDCNWLLFQMIVNLGFKRVGLPWDRDRMERNLDRVEQFYLANGWYADGLEAHCDYYGPFAIHFYQLIYAVMMEREDPERSAKYKARAASFAKQFIHWFADDGSALPYGRSLSYRFAQASFWSAMAYAGVEVYPMGVMKGIVLRHLRWWFRQPIYQADGTLSIGYAYPNLIMAENYNAPGSPYWALKTFLPLALAEDHPFWQAEELPLPELDGYSVQAEPHMIVCRQERSHHVLAFQAGYTHTNEHTHTSAKYEKFVYSNQFGFSVPRAEWGLGQGAYDSMLALSEGDNLYRVKRKSEEFSIHDRMIYTRWKPWRDVEVRTWLLAGTPWHVRVHRIHTERVLDVADGGFALGIEDQIARHDAGMDDGNLLDHWYSEQGEDRALAVSSCGVSGIVALYGGGTADIVYPHANTNLIHARTVIPTVRASLQLGVAWLVTAVYGQPRLVQTSKASGIENVANVDSLTFSDLQTRIDSPTSADAGTRDWAAADWLQPPHVNVSGDELVVYTAAPSVELFRIKIQ